jgi:hypothetical protein
MSFASWKQKSGTYQKVYYRNSPGDILLVCQAAYKAGERYGRKQVEEIASNTIELNNMLWRKKLATPDGDACK